MGRTPRHRGGDGEEAVTAQTSVRPARLSDIDDYAAARARLQVARAWLGDTVRQPRPPSDSITTVGAKRRLRALAAEVDAHRFGVVGPRGR